MHRISSFAALALLAAFMPLAFSQPANDRRDVIRRFPTTFEPRTWDAVHSLPPEVREAEARELPLMRAMVHTARPSDALAYYHIIGPDVGLPLVKTNELGEAPELEPFTLDGLVAYLGYAGLSALHLETLPSFDLMDIARLREVTGNSELLSDPEYFPGSILATRYFAPKITDVSGLTDPLHFGWRKVVRLQARPGSTALAHEVESAWILFNLFEPDPAADPFGPDKRSLNTQVMLISAERDGAPVKNHAAYFLVFDATAPDGTALLGNHLTATFDAAASNVQGAQQYFLPDACATCHAAGTLNRSARLNFIDTDHIYDRLTPPLGYFSQGGADVNAIPFDALYDGGKDHASGEYERAFRVLRLINGHVATQNRAADKHAAALAGAAAPPPSFQTRAVTKWLERHQSNSGHIPPIERVLDPIDENDPQWTSGNAADEAALSFLNEYCYRCHSSVEFSVFDKASLPKLSRIVLYISRNGAPHPNPTAGEGETGIDAVPEGVADDDAKGMPQDRLLTQEEKVEIIGFLKAALPDK